MTHCLLRDKATKRGGNGSPLGSSNDIPDAKYEDPYRFPWVLTGQAEHCLVRETGPRTPITTHRSQPAGFWHNDLACLVAPSIQSVRRPQFPNTRDDTTCATFAQCSGTASCKEGPGRLSRCRKTPCYAYDLQERGRKRK